MGTRSLIYVLHVSVSVFVIVVCVVERNYLALVGFVLQLFYYILFKGAKRLLDSVLSGAATIAIEKIISEDEKNEKEKERDSTVPKSHPKE
jgi:hypothetical protein